MRPKFLLAAIFFIFTGQLLFAQAPVITSFSPAQGAIGTLITITGTNLGSPTAFSVGGKSALVISSTGTQLVGYVMPGATSGVVSVTTSGGSVNSSTNFTVTPPATTAMIPQTASLEGQGFAYNNDVATVYQGNSVSVSADGNTGVVGASNSPVGEAFVWARTGAYGSTPMWTQQGVPPQSIAQGQVLEGIVLASVNTSNTEGQTAAISADGNTVILGAPGNNVTATDYQTGSFWCFTRSGANWTQQGSFVYGTGGVGGPQEGASVALSADGNTAIIGGPYDGANNSLTGAVWAFVRTNGVWTQQGTKLVGTGAIGGAQQGWSVAVSADGNTAVVGGLVDNGTIGAAWIFTRSGTTWTQQGNKLVGSDAAGEAEQGSSVAISADGNTVIVGGRFDNNNVGAGWIYTRNNGVWTQQGPKLVAVNTAANQGSSVAISADGNIVLVGGSAYNSNAGGVWEFTRNAGSWSLLGQPSNNLNSNLRNVGSALAISADGTTGFAGAGAGGGNGNAGGVVVFTAQAPTVVTQPATAITGAAATLNGTVDGNGPAATVTIQYSTSSNLSNPITATLTTGASPIPAGTGVTTFASALTGLAPATTYYFAISSTNVYGATQGDILSFTTLTVPPAITPGAVTGNILSCAGTPSTNPYLQQFAVSAVGLTTPLVVTAPTGFEVSSSASNGYAASINITPAAEAVNGIIYIRSVATAAPGAISGNVVVTSTGATTQNVAVTGIINALPAATAVPAQTFTNAVASTAINFAGTANSFSWTNDTPGIGLAASGDGNIASFSPVNTGSSPITAHITVTPTTAGFAYVPNLGGASVSAINTITNTVTATIPVGSEPYGVAVSPDGSRAYITNTYSSSVSVISTATNTVTSTISLTSEPQCIALSPDGKTAYITMANNTVSVVNTATNTVIASIPVGSYAYGLAVSPDGSRVYVANLGSNTVSIINTATNMVVASPVAGTGPIAVSVSPDGSRAYVSNYQSANMSVINTATNTVIGTITTGTTPCGSVVNAAGTQLYVANYGSNTVSVISLPAGTTTATVTTGASPLGVSLSSDGSHLFVTNAHGGSVTVINTATNTVSATVPVGSAPNSLGNFVTASGCSGAPVTFTITVNPTPAAPAVITFPAPAAVTYGSADVAPGATSTNTTTPITYTSSNTAVATIVNGNIHILSAGTTQITASQAAGDNYSAATPVTQTFTVNPAPLTITANNQVWPYAGTEPTLTVAYATFVNGDTPASLTTQPTVNTTATAASSLGSYPITVSGAVDPNYTITYVAGNLQVIPGIPTAATQPATAVTASGATLNGTINDNGQQTTVNIVYSTAPDLSSNPVFVQITSNSSGTTNINYNTDVTGLNPGTTYYFRISDVFYTGSVYGDILSFTTPTAPASVITFTAPTSAVYGSADMTPNGTSNNSSEPVTYSSSNAAVATITANGNIHIVSAGTTQITASQAAGGSFAAANPVSITFTVNPAPLTVTAGSPTAVYGSGIPAIPVTYSGFVNSDTAASLTSQASAVSTATGSSGVGNYPTTANGAADPNYNITYVAGNLSITPAPLTITANNQSTTYGAGIPPLTVSYFGLVNDDSQNNLTTQPSASTTATITSVAGTYPITVSGAVDPNYMITYVAGTLTVGAVSPTALTQAATSLGSGGATLNGTVSDGGASTTVQFLFGTDPHLNGAGTLAVTTGTSPIPAGTGRVAFTAAVTGLNPGTTYYYEIMGTNSAGSIGGGILSFTTATVPVAVITFTSPTSAVYGAGDLTPNATSNSDGAPITYYSSNAAVASITDAGGIHVAGAGTTQITASQAGGGGYTAATPVTITLAVLPASLSITAGSPTAVYGAGIPAITVTYVGFVNGDSQSSLTTAASGSTTAIAGSGVGNYPTTAGGAADPNYNITYLGGILTITPAALTITANNQTIVAGSAIPTLTVSYSGFVDDDSQASLTTQPMVSTTATASSGAGTYPITVSGAADPNYTITYFPGTLTITPLLVFNPVPAKTYGDPDFNPAATGTNVTYSSGNTAVATITDGGNVHIVGAGSVTITATSGGTSISQTVVINPASLTIAANDQSRTYGADNLALTLTYTGFVYSDDAASLSTAPIVATTAAAGSDVGSYPITVSGAVDPNYTITYVPGKLSVTPAALTITADNQTKQQGAANPLLTVTYSGFVNNNTADDLSSPPVVETTALTSSDPGTYPITVSGAVDPNYAITYVSGTLTILPPPTLVANNILTPNGDGVNDVWVVHDIQFYPDNTVTIYDRAGRQVYSARGYNNDWAGTANGKPLQEGTYYYVLVLKPDLPIIRGFISIIRSK